MGEARPRPPVNRKNEESVLADIGIDRKTGKIWRKVELCKGWRAKASSVLIRCRVQISRKAGLCGLSGLLVGVDAPDDDAKAIGTSSIRTSASSICTGAYPSSRFRSIFLLTNPEIDFPILSPKSKSFSFEGRLSLSHRVAKSRHVARTTPLKSAGNAYGYLNVHSTPSGFL